MAINKKKRLTDSEKIALASTFDQYGRRVWTEEGLDKFTIKQLHYIFSKSQTDRFQILIDHSIFFVMWKRIQRLEKKVGL